MIHGGWRYHNIPGEIPEVIIPEDPIFSENPEIIIPDDSNSDENNGIPDNDVPIYDTPQTGNPYEIETLSTISVKNLFYIPEKQHKKEDENVEDVE